MNVLDAIKGRRSIRRFSKQAISDDDLRTVLEAAQWAPSWANTQCWEIIVIRGTDQKEKLADLLSPKNPAIPATRKAPVVLVICGGLKKAGYYKGEIVTKFGDWFLHDLGLATQNICLAAHALGLGTVIAGLFDHDKAREILKIPEGYEALTIIPLGHPDQQPGPPKRRMIKDFTHYEVFGRK